MIRDRQGNSPAQKGDCPRHFVKTRSFLPGQPTPSSPPYICISHIFQDRLKFIGGNFASCHHCSLGIPSSKPLRDHQVHPTQFNATNMLLIVHESGSEQRPNHSSRFVLYLFGLNTIQCNAMQRNAMQYSISSILHMSEWRHREAKQSHMYE